MTHVHAQGFSFKVHPAGFLVHRPHGRSRADVMYQSAKAGYEAAAKSDPTHAARERSLAGTTHRFRNRMLAALATGGYAPAVDGGISSCVERLPWWRGPKEVLPAEGHFDHGPRMGYELGREDELYGLEESMNGPAGGSSAGSDGTRSNGASDSSSRSEGGHAAAPNNDASQGGSIRPEGGASAVHRPVGRAPVPSLAMHPQPLPPAAARRA